MNFESGIKELEEIIIKLESGQAGFNEASSLFERGAQICKQLNASLEEAKGKVTVIREQLGALIEEELN